MICASNLWGMAKLFTTLWTTHRAATIAVTVGLVAAIGVGGWLLLRNPGGSEETTTSAPVPAPAPPAPQTTNWPTYGLDAARTRYMPTHRVRPPYKVAWTYDARHLMEYSPIVVGDTLYGIDNNGEAFALNTRNGKQRWRRDVATLNASAPTYSDGRLYVSNLEPGQVQALKARNGKVAWQQLPSGTDGVLPARRRRRGDRGVRVRFRLRLRQAQRQAALEHPRRRRSQGVARVQQRGRLRRRLQRRDDGDQSLERSGEVADERRQPHLRDRDGGLWPRLRRRSRGRLPRLRRGHRQPLLVDLHRWLRLQRRGGREDSRHATHRLLRLL